MIVIISIKYDHIYVMSCHVVTNRNIPIRKDKQIEFVLGLPTVLPACWLQSQLFCQQSVGSKHALATGRVPTILVLRLTGVAFMGFMGLFPQVWTKLGVIIPVHILRTAIIRSASPLEKSILMDYVPKASLCCARLLPKLQIGGAHHVCCSQAMLHVVCSS